MRLREIYIIYKKGYKEIFSQYQRVVAEYDKISRALIKSSYVQVSEENFNLEIKRFIFIVNNNIGNIECLRDILKHDVDCILNEDNQFDIRMQSIVHLVGVIYGIIELYESMGLGLPNEKSIGLDIKLPKTDNITDFKKCVDGLEFVFTKCPFFQSDEASLKFDSVDVGSVWLVIGVACISIAAGSMLLNNIAAFIDKCLIIKSHKLTCKRQEQEIRRAELEQKEKEELLKNVNKLYKIAVKNVIKELEESTGHKINDGDEMGRVEQSFERLEKMINEGLQIYASIDSPKEVQAVFAPLEMYYLSVGDELKKIEEAAKAGREQKS